MAGTVAMTDGDIQNIEKVFSNLPITLHFDYRQNPNTIIGWANAYQSLGDGTTTIVMSLDAEASEKLKSLCELFRLYSLAFTGIARKPETQGE